MADLKTKPTKESVDAFLSKVTPEQKKRDAFKLLEIFEKVSGEKAVMWGSSIVGFGKYHYKSERSTQEGDWPLTGFSPRKQNLTIYIMPGFESLDHLLSKLGKHKRSVSCIYINKLSDVDLEILTKIIAHSLDKMKEVYG